MIMLQTCVRMAVRLNFLTVKQARENLELVGETN